MKRFLWYLGFIAGVVALIAVGYYLLPWSSQLGKEIKEDREKFYAESPNGCYAPASIFIPYAIDTYAVFASVSLIIFSLDKIENNKIRRKNGKTKDRPEVC